MDFTLYNVQLKRFIDWLVPPQCAQCESELDLDSHNIYCANCEQGLPYSKSSCQRCGQPFSGFNDHCGSCLHKPPIFDACFCAFEYRAPISDDICRLKYGDQPQLAKRLAQLFIQELNQYDIELPDALISVPMHKSKLRKRGFNQSHELAKCISKQLDLPLTTGALKKAKPTPRQATQTLIQRKTNLKGSFEVQEKLPFKHIAIVDDVVTTGSTAEEIAKILKKNGVDYIQVWGIARTI